MKKAFSVLVVAILLGYVGGHSLTRASLATYSTLSLKVYRDLDAVGDATFGRPVPPDAVVDTIRVGEEFRIEDTRYGKDYAAYKVVTAREITGFIPYVRLETAREKTEE